MKKFFLFIVFLSSLLNGFSVTAQNKKRDKECSAFTINTSNSTIKFEVLSNKESFHPEEALTYYWYSTNKILETKGGYDGKLLHGQYSCFYMNNNLKEKGKFKKGLKDGEWITWFESGKIMEIITWKGGIRNGKYKSFDETGHPVLEAEYRKGMLNGKMTTYLKGEVSDVKVYRNDKEVPPKVKKEKQKGNESNKKIDPNSKKKTLKERWNKLFKKDKKDQKDKPVTSPTKPVKEKKKFFNRFHKNKNKENDSKTTTNTGKN